MDTTKKIRVDFEIAPKLREWFDAGRGICVWSNKDLSSHRLGDLSFTPGDKPTPPHWSVGTHPDLVTYDRTLFEVEKCKEVKRVKVRRGPPSSGHVHRQDAQKLQNALTEAGQGAYYVFDHTNSTPPWLEAVVMIPDSVEPL